jgi:hypothetical protein
VAERQLPKLYVVGSIPIARSKFASNNAEYCRGGLWLACRNQGEILRVQRGSWYSEVKSKTALPRDTGAARNITLLTVFFACWICAVEAQHSSTSSYPDVFIRYEGLDVRNNRIDALISMFGFICVRNPFNPTPCRIETELLAYLRTFPGDLKAIARELTALNATCLEENNRVNCLINRHVKTTAGIQGSSDPPEIIDEFFRIGLTVTSQSGGLEYGVT